MSVVHNYINTYLKSVFPTNLLSWILFVFIICVFSLFGYGQVMIIGIPLAGIYTLYFLKEKKSMPLEIVIFFIWLMWSSTGFIVSIDKERFFEVFKRVFQISVMSFAIAGITSKQERLDLNFLAILISGIVFMIYGLSLEKVQIAMDQTEKVRVYNEAFNPNHYAWIILIFTVSVLYFLSKGRFKRSKIVLYLLLIIAAFAIIYSGSRKSFVGFIVLILLWQWMCNKKQIINKPYLFIGLFFTLISLFYLTDFMLSNTIMGDRFRQDDTENRTSLYIEGYELLKHSPIFGVGLGNFSVYESTGAESHSEYIEILVSGGFVGFVLYFSIYILLWQRLSRIQKRSDDPEIYRTSGLLKATLIMMLIIGFGRPHFTSREAWVLLSTAIGYAWSIENILLKNETYCRKKR